MQQGRSEAFPTAAYIASTVAGRTWSQRIEQVLRRQRPRRSRGPGWTTPLLHERPGTPTAVFGYDTPAGTPWGRGLAHRHHIQRSGPGQVAALGRGLERRYDELTAGRGSRLLADGARLPTADELAVEFGRYLSDRPESDDDTSP